MKRFLLPGSLGATVLCGLLACSSVQQTEAGRPVAIAVVMDGGGVPTAAQIAAIYSQVRPGLARLGYVLAANPRLAELVVQVKFTPDLNGGAGGRVSILTVAPDADGRQRAAAAREQLKESSAKAIRSQITEPR